MAHDTKEQELDADGLVVQKYSSRVLIVLPQEGFGDQILRYARSSLYNVHVGTVSCTLDADREVKGRLQDEFLVDEPLAGQDMGRYSGILVAGGEGACSLCGVEELAELVRRAAREEKLIGAWGNGLEVLARAGILKGKRVTGAPEARDDVARARGKYTGREVEVCGNLITARDEGAGMRFGQALAEYVRI